MQVGIIVPHLGYNQLAFTLLMQVHANVGNLNITPIIFQKDIVPPYLVPMCTVTNLAEIFSFRGLLVTTSLADTKIALNNARMCQDILLYAWDLDWLRKDKNFLDNYKTYQAVKVVAQNEYHAQAIEKYTGKKPIFNVENFDLKKIVKLYENQQP